MASAIEVDALRKSYGSAVVLSDLTLTVPSGIYSLLGPNGAGKTTLVNILTTLVKPDGGTASICGVPLTDRRCVRQQISVTGQFAAVDALLTPAENLVLIGRLLGMSARRARGRADELIDSFDLSASAGKLVRDLSGGTARRVDLAMSLVQQPKVLFLDEPTTGLDPTSRRRLWADIRALARTGTTVLLTTQYLEEAEALADRIGVLAQGRIVAEGTAAELTARIGGEELVLTTGDGEVVRTLTTDGTAGGVAAALAQLGSDAAGLHVELRRPTLEDAFASLTGSGIDREKVAA
ncbi:ABC transporter ATP-binding protein [Pseudactinotalea terrae]|uniref:ABC transporter ATP-binding protein n=1 Tax=Pseudactinotalea terrae TaxID=1743262 RepID=UPI0012E297FD|nr:ATP-binding cassette domain-containing protein [Pseudactinotalea terrae]